MDIIDRGAGAPLVMVPGIQGRWEYMRPAIDQLTAYFRVITFPLCGERGSPHRVDPTRGLDDFVDQIDDVLDDRGLSRATICGVSFGGLVALRFAAHRPSRTSALVLVSPPGPSFRLQRRHRFYARLPRLLGPLFLAEVPRRVGAEIARAIPDRSSRRRFAWNQIATLARAPLSFSRMAARAQLIGLHDWAQDCVRVRAPALVVTGETSLDRVVSADAASDYLRLLPQARAARLERTGHLGYITRPREFAATLREFLAATGPAELAPPGGVSRTAAPDERKAEGRTDAA
jgi:pimeloyl-ACP methyl ester carboxylesterase